jgi:hypothetical protein
VVKTVCTGWPTIHTIPHHQVRVLGDDGVDDGRVSHGICPECLTNMDIEAEVELAKLLKGEGKWI